MQGRERNAGRCVLQCLMMVSRKVKGKEVKEEVEKETKINERERSK